MASSWADRGASATDRLDLLINNAGVNSPTSPRSSRKRLDYAEVRRVCDVNELGSLRVVEAFLPLTARGTLKRLCFVSSQAGSTGAAERTISALCRRQLDRLYAR